MSQSTSSQSSVASDIACRSQPKDSAASSHESRASSLLSVLTDPSSCHAETSSSVSVSISPQIDTALLSDSPNRYSTASMPRNHSQAVWRMTVCAYDETPPYTV
ncbi:hypothetical protein [Bifidobacterium pullorum]|uniref:hypothetical protein n=1 Tax=Bifidobacterium pullorum TaxID=78448 RepID=UPI0006892559|nr:hypothetical protein [Bifidobacterium pullorum]